MFRIQSATALVLGLALSACATVPQQTAPVEVGIAAFNDFHGSLEPPKQAVIAPDGKGGSVAVPAGGAAWLASTLTSIRARHPNHLTVSAGDLTGASQLSSSLFLDEPTVGVMNRLGLDFNAVGNHEFDRGAAELQRLHKGGCQQLTRRKPCMLESFPGETFSLLAASTVDAQGRTLFPASGIRRFGKGRSQVSIGVIGLTLKGTPDLVDRAGIAGLTFRDEAETINAEVPRLKAQGADAIVVLIHQGGRQAGNAPDPNGCAGLAGEIRPILDRLDPRVDLVVSGHTHAAYVCDGPGPLLTSAGLYGTMVTDIVLAIDPRTHKVVRRSARNVIVQSAPFTSAKGPVPLTQAVPQFAPDPAIAAYVGRYVEAAKAEASRPVGRLSGPATRGEGPDGGTLGNLVADSQLAATRDAGAQIAFMNPFGLRAALVPAADGRVSFGDLYAVQPFGNNVVTETLTGAEIKAALEQGLDDKGPEQVLSASTGFAWTFDRSRPAGDRILSVSLDGRPIDPAASYRVTINGFLALGGDGFTVFAGKPGATIGPTDIDAFERWIAAAPVRDVPQESRAVSVNP